MELLCEEEDPEDMVEDVPVAVVDRELEKPPFVEEERAKADKRNIEEVEEE